MSKKTRRYSPKTCRARNTRQLIRRGAHRLDIVGLINHSKHDVSMSKIADRRNKEDAS
jgi:hypothetical protein